MLTQKDSLLNDFQWILDIVQNVDVGLVLIDRNTSQINLWNSFMQNHSALGAEQVIGKKLFELFPEVDHDWFHRKVESVCLLKNSAFTTWEQRPYLFRFENYRPITGKAEFMYQNTTFIPVQSVSGQIDGICLIIYDVTEQAINHKDLENANNTLEIISRTDGLTGLLNRKAWEERLEQEFQRCKRYNEVNTLIIFDIDHFKVVNDTYGHPAGDEVIRKTSDVVRQCTRKVDISGRYGGEEYVILLPKTNVDSAEILAERIRKRIESQPVTYLNQTIQYTVSLGICQFDKGFNSPTQWLDAADKGLYQAKQGGRNQYCIFSVSD